uniref:EF-hand domain-containing protein n=1 Tax=Bicosoecida sp. CB-2014 TaxID=1486930 RepID=A0A7S1CIC3_9STRA|mmetsp:Transcript_278/g.856  ORF Transcript_278/g.856 Transcript_278/m.856 type:complete len:154 (+) Transcript_278:69-530(+)
MHRTAGYSSSGASGGAGGGGGMAPPRAPKALKPLAPIGGVKPPRGGKLPPLEVSKKAVSEEQMAAAKLQFDSFDSDSSGTINKAELRTLLGTLDLNFSDAMFDAYVQTAFRDADRDLSGDLDFEEFQKIYAGIIFESRKQGFSFQEWKKHKGT